LCSNMGSRIAANSKGLITAIVVGIGFYIFNTAIGLLTDGGQLPATYAAWFPNILFAGLAGYLLLQKEGY
ncbi:MAG: LptF/LptG family permease, partial [Ghiorsea sp.]